MQTGRRNIGILFFTLVVVMIGFGMIIPILPFYVQHFGASGSALGLLMATYGVMQFLFAPVWGQISDRIGRKPVILIGVLGTLLSNVLFGLATSLWALYAARALAGILSSATLPTAMAYISDNTTGEQRGGGMGLMGAAMGLGMVIGPGLGGTLSGYSLGMPFFVAAGLAALALVLISLLVPESLPAEARKHGKVTGVQLKPIVQALAGPLGILFFMAFLLSFGLTNFEGIFGLFAAERFGYDSRQVGTILTVVGLISAVVQGGLMGPLSRRFGEVLIIRASLIGTAIGFVLMLTAGSFASVLLTVGFFVTANAMLNPAVSSLISKRTQAGQGAAMGLNNSFQSLGRIAGPVWAGMVFDLNQSYPYLTGAVIMIIGFVMSIMVLRHTTQNG